MLASIARVLVLDVKGRHAYFTQRILIFDSPSFFNFILIKFLVSFMIIDSFSFWHSHVSIQHKERRVIHLDPLSVLCLYVYSYMFILFSPINTFSFGFFAQWPLLLIFNWCIPL
jgi:hypothetical protein